MADDKKNDNVFVTALNPGKQRLGLGLHREPGGTVAVEISEPGHKERVIRVSQKLRIL